MRFNRADLANSAAALVASGDTHERCIGFNYRVEENVSDARRDDVESFDPSIGDVRELVDAYFRDTVQGIARGHRPSTFDEKLNGGVILPDTIEPNQKVVRLERIDRVMAGEDLDFGRLRDALRSRDSITLTRLADLFAIYPGERPAFAAFRSEVDEDLRQPDWLQRIIDRLGLLHHYPFDPQQSYSFALMEYTAKDVMDQAAAKAIDRCFAVATVLECQQNPAFFPVPRGAAYGFTVDLRERVPLRPSAREILHMRFDYSWSHIRRLEQWTGSDKPDLAAARARHLTVLREVTRRRDFGEIAP